MAGPKQLRLEAFEALRQRRDAVAADLLSRYLDEAPNDTEAELALAVARSGQGKHAAALAIFDRHLEREPESPVLHFNRGTTLERLGRKIDAVRSYELVLRLNPNHAKARQRLDVLRGIQPRPNRVEAVEEIPEVLAVDDEEALETWPPRRGRWIHPIALIGLLLFVVGLIVLSLFTMSAYGAGGFSAITFFSGLGLLAGLQAIHRGREGDGRYPVPLGYILTGGGAAGLVTALGIMVVFLAAGDRNPVVAAKPMARQQPPAQNPAPRNPFKKVVKESHEDLEPENKKVAQVKTEQIDKAVQDIGSGNADRIKSGCIVLWVYFQADRRSKVVPLLEGLLTHEDHVVRLRAAHALAAWGTRESIPKLEALQGDDEDSVRTTAEKAITDIKNREPDAPTKDQP